MRDKTFSFWTLLNKGAKKVTMEEFVKVFYQLKFEILYLHMTNMDTGSFILYVHTNIREYLPPMPHFSQASAL